METLEKTLRESHDWALDRIEWLSYVDVDDARSIQKEFEEWLNPDIPEHDIFSLDYIGD